MVNITQHNIYPEIVCINVSNTLEKVEKVGKWMIYQDVCAVILWNHIIIKSYSNKITYLIFHWGRCHDQHRTSDVKPPVSETLHGQKYADTQTLSSSLIVEHLIRHWPAAITATALLDPGFSADVETWHHKSIHCFIRYKMSEIKNKNAPYRFPEPAVASCWFYLTKI